MNIIPKMSGAALTDDKLILETLLNSEIGKKAIADRQKDVLAFRTSAAKKLAELDAAAGASFPKLRAAREAAEAEAIAAERRWREACDRAQQARQAISTASFAHDAALREAEAKLLSTAHPEIALFVSEMDDAHEACFRQFGYSNGSETNRITGKRVDYTVNNAASIQARQHAIREAQERARQMRLEPDQTTVPARLQELRNGLPAIKGLEW
ncbi:hypothetical protein ABID59_001433 [Bradyrhizobium sp. S3.3.6]|uniref:hypothetical protein n=1 Tax=Bradyrhizobium sp. S3.3.6 TaxID=3156429 RepID=UPI00339362AE